jgi:hypothetical protein
MRIKQVFYMRNFKIILLLILFISSLSENSFSQERKKLAQTGLKFLSVPLDAKATGLGDAVTSINMSASAMFYNPSTMAELNNNAIVSFGTTRWIADINYIFGSAALNLFDGEYGVFGVSMVAVDYGEFQGTVFAPTDDGYIDVGTFEPKAYAFGIGYAKKLSEKFSVGGDVRYVKQSIGTAVTDITSDGQFVSSDYKIDAVSFDFGILYKTGYKSLNFGMSVRNFSTEIEYEEESFQLPLTFKLGVSVDALDFLEADKEMHSFLISVDASHPRDFSEQVFFGGEYTFMKIFSIRGGYSFPNDEQEFTAGLGLKKDFSNYLVGVDYSYTRFGIFSDVHRFTVNIGL